MDELRIDRSNSALILIDIQNDFLPGGLLPVPDGNRILEPTRNLMEAGRFAHLIATQDWHPPGHVSFASRHPGAKPFDVIQLHGHEQTLWPDHCVQGTPGSALHPGLPWDRVSAVLRKGRDPLCDSYSGFRNNWNQDGRRPATGLAGLLREIGVRDLFLCGLARDVCVKWSAEDAIDLGFRVTILWDLTRPVDPASDDRVRRDLETRGVVIERSDRIDL